MQKNKLDKVFGDGGSSTGLFIFLGGIGILYYSLIGIIVALVGAFVAFTSTFALIDTEQRRIKPGTNLFGIIPTGKWIDFDATMCFKIIKSQKGTSTATRGHARAFINKDFRIILLDKNKKAIAAIKKFETLKAAEDGLEQFNKEFLL